MSIEVCGCTSSLSSLRVILDCQCNCNDEPQCFGTSKTLKIRMDRDDSVSSQLLQDGITLQNYLMEIVLSKTESNPNQYNHSKCKLEQIEVYHPKKNKFVSLCQLPENEFEQLMIMQHERCKVLRCTIVTSAACNNSNDNDDATSYEDKMLITGRHFDLIKHKNGLDIGGKILNICEHLNQDVGMFYFCLYGNIKVLCVFYSIDYILFVENCELHILICPN